MEAFSQNKKNIFVPTCDAYLRTVLDINYQRSEDYKRTEKSVYFQLINFNLRDNLRIWMQVTLDSGFLLDFY